MPPEHEIRPAEPQDHAGILSLVSAETQAGDALPWDPDAARSELASYWLPEPRLGVEVFVCHVPAAAGRGVAGVFVLHPCIGGRVRHVAQGSFLVAPALRGQGLGRRLCERGILEARERGYGSMRFNMVVSTNAAAIRVCQACGFKIMCTLPLSFNHAKEGLVDTHVMFCALDSAGGCAGSRQRRSFPRAVRDVATPQSAVSSPPPHRERSHDFTPADSPVHISEDIAIQLEKVGSLAELKALEAPSKTRAYGDWMMWMVHRAWLNDPELTELDFSGMRMPDGHVERRIAPRLMEAVGSNTHLRVLSLSSANVQKAQGVQLAESLRKNTTLRVVNLEGNRLDSMAVRALALAVADNPNCGIEHFRLQHQGQAGVSFGRPAEEAVGQMMQSNQTIVKLGFECDDRHWRNVIDAALVRNNDASRRQQAAAQDALRPASQEVTLGQVLLQSAPAACTERSFLEDGSFRELYRSYVVQTGKLPTIKQLLSCAKNSGQPLQYSAAAPFVKECRTWFLQTAIGTNVLATDAFGIGKEGRMVDWSETNDCWSIELVAHEDDKHYAFRSSREPAFAVSDAWVEWLGQERCAA